MVDVLLRVLVGWLGLSCLTAVGWSVLVTRYKARHGRRTAQPRQSQAADTPRAA